MQKNLPIVGLLARPKLLFTFIAVSGTLFYVNYYTMTKLPGTNGYQCLIGANFTPLNIVFSALISLLVGFLAAGLVELYHRRKVMHMTKVGSASTIGVSIGTLTTFCTLCSIPTISLFGIGVSLAFITQYELYFKAVSLILLGGAIYLLNRQLRGLCKICVI